MAPWNSLVPLRLDKRMVAGRVNLAEELLSSTWISWMESSPGGRPKSHPSQTSLIGAPSNSVVRGVGPHAIGLRDAGGIDARHRGQQRLIAAPVDRQLLDALAFEGMAERGSVDAHHRGDVVDFDLGRGLAHLQRRVDHSVLLRADGEGSLELLHAGGLDGNLVLPGIAPGNTYSPASLDTVLRATLVAVLVRVTLAFGNDGAGLVRNRAANRAAAGLRPSGGGEKQERDEG